MDIVEFYNKVENIVKKDKNSLKSGYYIVSNKMIGSVNMSFKGWGHYIKISNLSMEKYKIYEIYYSASW